MPILAAAWLLSLAQDPASQPAEQDDLEKDFAELAGAFAPGWNVDVHAAMRAAYINTPRDDAASTSFDTARLWIEGEFDRWLVHFGWRAERGPGYGFFGIPDQVGEMREHEVWVRTPVFDFLDFRIGRFKAPVVTSTMIPETGLLLYHRTFIGNDWDSYSTGAALEAHFGPLRGSITAQDGEDDDGKELAWTARGDLDLVGEGISMLHEGAYGASKKLAVTVGGSIYYDTYTHNRSAQAAEVRMTGGSLFGLGPFSLSGEYLDTGDGLGNLFSWGGVASVMLLEDLELAGAIEDFDRDDGTDLWRGSLSYYMNGHDAKLQLIYAQAESNAPVASGDTWMLGLTIGI
jgi:hypothetical protein